MQLGLGGLLPNLHAGLPLNAGRFGRVPEFHFELPVQEAVLWATAPPTPICQETIVMGVWVSDLTERLYLALPASLPWRSQREGLGSKILLKLMKATIIINILYTNSKHRNPLSFRLVWTWEMDRSRMSFPVPKEGLCWRGLDSKWQVI